MSGPLLKTKLHIPPAHADLVARPHLVKRLNIGLREKLTLISAPAGFGKTTLLSNFIPHSSLPFSWISLDEDDNAPTRFLTYLVAALQTIEPNIGEAILPALQSPQPPPILSVLPFLINDIADCPDIVLVLDDYHVIKAQAVHELVGYLLQHMPANLHLVITTRVDPPLPLPRLRGRQQLTELRSADLRFSDEEADIFCNQTKKLELPDRDVTALNARTEGWITGLQMAVFSLQGQDDKSRFVQSFTGSNRYVIDYLLEEVLEQQSESMRTFLLQTSILNELCGGLCQAVTGENRSQQILEEMEHANLFLIPLDARREWFRYHLLFADLLQQRLLLNNPDLVSTLHQRASHWYEENGSLGQAIEHALAATDHASAVRLLEKYVQSMWEYGDQSRLTKWLSILPEESVQKHPALSAQHAFALCFAGEFDAAESQLALVEKNVDLNDTLFQGMAATVRAFCSLYQNQIEVAASHALLALEHLPADQHMWRSLALSIHGDVNAYHGHVPTCEQIWQDGLHEARLAGCTFFALWISAKLVFTQRRLGRLRQAAKTFEEQTRRALKKGYTQMAVAGGLYSVYGDVLLEWNRVNDAIEYIQRGLSLSERQNYMAGVAWSSIAMINAHYVQAGIEGAEEALRQLEIRYQMQNLPGWTLNWFTAWKVRLLIAQDDLTGAEQVLQVAGITPDGEFGYPNEVEYLALTRLLMAKGNLPEAQKLLMRLQTHLDSTEWLDKIIEAQILQALIYQMQDDMAQALTLLASVLDLAQPEGYTRVFINEGLPMARLLYKALEADIQSEYVSKLLTAFPAPEETSPTLKSAPTLVEPLSTRELDVLRQVAKGDTNQEVAQTLHIALGTVKNHLKNIYAKLNVHSRTQAVARARDLDLLP